ncbi:glycyl radical enzyme domain-containing protein [Salmonella enterica]
MIVSCYNSLPLGGGGSTLVRLNQPRRSVDDSFHVRYRTTDSRSPSFTM